MTERDGNAPIRVLAIDQGTSSTRCRLYAVDDTGVRPLAQSQQEFASTYPRAGWVEQDAEVIWQSTLATLQGALRDGGARAGELAAIGITNQRETTVLWERATGRPVAPAIVWQDRRTSERCRQLERDGHLPLVRARTGLVLDPYFSATKLAWLLDNVEGARARAQAGELAFGTIDSWLIWQLTGGRSHVTDLTNASRTSLFDIHRQCWDAELCALFDVPEAVLPRVVPSAGAIAEADPQVVGAAIPIAGVAGDQQAALVGQGGCRPGLVKATYGTGCFAVLHTGERAVESAAGLLTTIAYGTAGQTHYALEGSLFVAGSAIKWLRDAVGMITSAAETEALARAGEARAEDIVFVPAFNGLGTPWWDADARAAFFGLTLESGRAELVTAVLRSTALQSADLIEAFAADLGTDYGGLSALRIDGGMVVNDWFCQALADALGLRIERPVDTETTALGAALLALVGIGVAASVEEAARFWALERAFEPATDAAAVALRADRRQRWLAAVDGCRRFAATAGHGDATTRSLQ